MKTTTSVLASLLLFGCVLTQAKLDLRWFLDRGLDVYAPVSPALGEGPCRAQGLAFKQAVIDGQDWALNMLDASSKPPPGVLTGNMVLLGNYDQCLDVEYNHYELGRIVGQHCMVKIGAQNVFTLDTLADKFQEYGVYQTQIKHLNELLNQSETAEAFRRLGATVSVCMPAACSPRDVEVHLKTTLRGLMDLDVNVSVSENGCNSRIDPPPPLMTITVVAIVLILTFVGAVILGSAYDLLIIKEHRNKALLAFSFPSNFKSLTKSSGVEGALPVLDGVRVLSALWVIIVHHYNFNMTVPSVNYHTVMRTDTDWAHIVTSNGTLCVDSFLLLAGTLLAYNFLRDRQKGLQFDLVKFYMQRYARVAPTMLAMSLIAAILANLAGDGPLVKANAALAREECANVWWSLLFVSNYVPVSPKCVGVTWYLSLDMQLVWISPLLLIPLWRWPRIGKSILGATLVAGVALLFAIAYFNEVTLSKFFTLNRQRDIYEGLTYLPTHSRFTPWLVGLCLGYALQATGAPTSPRRYHRLLAVVGLIAGLALLASSLLYAHQFFQGDAPYDKMATSLYVALMRPSWAAGLALLVFVCVSGYGGVINSFLSWPGFLVPSRLTFAVYLSHWTVVSGYHATMKHPRYFSDATMVVEFLGLAVLSFASALFLHLFFEAPAAAVSKLLLNRPTARLPELKEQSGALDMEKGKICLETRDKKLRSLFGNCEKTK